MYDVDNLLTVDIGRRGEKNARTVYIDVKSMVEEYPDAEISLVMRRTGVEDTPYEVDSTVEDGVLAWHVGEADTYYDGDHKIEIRAVKDGLIAKSRLAIARVERAIDNSAETDPPDVLQTWIDALTEALAIATALPGASTQDDLDYILGV